MKNIIANQKGASIVTAAIAAVLVVIIAYVVGNFISNQSLLNQKIEISGSCQNIANTVLEHIKKDEVSMYITSYGPVPNETEFPSGLSETEDGLDRFVFNSVRTPLFLAPLGFQMSIPNGNTSMPAGWRYFNHFNIKNSINRLVTLAANDNFCCSSLNISDPNCGTIFYSGSTPRPGFNLLEKDVEIKLGVNLKNSNGTSLCTARQLALANLPDSRFSGTADFAVQVTAGKNTSSEKKCSAQGSVQQTSDVTASLTLLEMQDQPSLCGTKSGLPSHCNSGSNVLFKVKTVKNSSGTSCESQCLSQIQSKTCSNIAPGSLSLFNSFSHANCVNGCMATEPGSAFLCKIGEKNWFNNVANINRWEPCEVAKIYDYDNSEMVGANVSIQYTPLNTNDSPEVSTNATITLSGLTEGRAYVVDVRAIDTKGNIGPSFCSTSPNSCESASQPHFVAIPGTAVSSALVDDTNYVNSAGTSVGRDATLISQPRYSTALSPFGSSQFQCQSGAPRFSLPITYGTPIGAYGALTTNTCTASLTDPVGVVSTPPCVCSAGDCSSQLPVSVSNGSYQFSMNVQNDCGGAGIIKTKNWCMDSNVAIGITNSGNKTFGHTPDFSTHITYPTVATKACGIVSLCPNVGGGFTPTMGPCPNTTIGWDPMQHSGCLQDPANNYCMLAMDPCGRSQSTTSRYSTSLIDVLYTSSPPVNFCFQFAGNPVGGNYCGVGAYCSATGKCFTGCATPPCPSNLFTATAIDCRPRYCTALNSCPMSIGSVSSTGSCDGGTVVNGSCGSSNGGTFPIAPTANLCNSGTATVVTGTGPWNWSCNGSGGGTDASCSALLDACISVPRQATCFSAGTEVELADGKSQLIEKIKIGEKVLIFDEETFENKISVVTEVLHHEAANQMMYKFNLENESGFIVTGEHLIFTANEGYVPAMHLYKDFRIGKSVLLFDQNKKSVKVSHITAYEDSVPTYNLHVKGISSDLEKYGRNGRGHNYFANGILVHNIKGCSGTAPVRWPGTGRYCFAADIVDYPGFDLYDCATGPDYTGCKNDLSTCGPSSTNGACGTANGASLSTAPSGAELCASGTASAVNGVGPWDWQCLGIGYGTDANCSALKSTACTNCTWKRVGSEDIGCGFETCCQYDGNSCPTQGAIRRCCRGPAGLCNQAVAGRRQELRCIP